MECYAALLDTRSVQKYIFAGSKLKTNIGASYLVEQAMSGLLLDVLKDKVTNGEQFEFGIGKDDWRKSETLSIIDNPAQEAEIAYIGGGNAIILFRQEDTARKVVAAFTRRLLLAAPGLKTGAAIGPVKIGEKDEEDSIKELYKQLHANQSKITPAVSLPYTGLTIPDEGLGGTVACVNEETYDKASNKTLKRYISAETKAKLAVADEANERLREKFDATRDGDYYFPDTLEDLGQREGDEYIAIVHVDGNNMGKKFNDCQNILARRRLSANVAEATARAFSRLISEVVVPEYQHYENIMAEKVFADNKLPIRPLIIGGDDITFVVAAKFALNYTKRLIEFMAAEKLPLNGAPVQFSACGGIAIFPTKYPFFRAYRLAEELCSAAKKKSRASEHDPNAPANWLDYAILHGEQASDLATMRRREYTAALGNLHYGPYAVAPLETPHSVEILLSGVSEFLKRKENGELVWPRTKLKGLRDVLLRGAQDIKLYLEMLERQSLRLPDAAGQLRDFAENVWLPEGERDKKVTPYMDMIEMTDFVYELKTASGGEAE